MANRSQKARMLRHRKRGKFANWTANPRGGTQAPLKAYSMKRYTGPSKDIELWNNMTLGARAAAAQSTADVPIPPTKGLTFGRVINANEGPLPRLLVLDKLQQMENTWPNEVEYEKWITQYNHIRLLNGEQHKVDVFFSGTIHVVVEVTRSWARRSTICRSFKQAKRLFERKQIRWAEIKEF